MSLKSPTSLTRYPIDEHIGFMVDDGVDMDDPESAEAAAEVLQAEQEAYFVKKGA